MKIKITKSEYEKTEEQARVASIFLNSAEYSFIRELLTNALAYTEEQILNNTVHDVTEEVTISDKIKKLFFTPKKVQIDELKGQYKIIKKFFSDVEYFASLKSKLDAEIAQGSVSIEEENKETKRAVNGKVIRKDINYARG